MIITTYYKSSKWADLNPTLAVDEIGIETDTKKRKIGDGVSRWNELTYQVLPPDTIQQQLQKLKIQIVQISDSASWLSGSPGPQGPAGPQGPVGPQGPQGLAGPTGPQGPAGTQGPVGSTGPAGEQGVPGNDGSTGPTGPQGPQGIAGEQGPTGPQGPMGPTGPQGIAGEQGPIGLKGDKGDPLDGCVSITDPEFGSVVGDGAVDCTAGIQAALNTGKNVFIPPAALFYKITDTLTFFSSSQKIFGLGVKSWIKQTGVLKDILRATGKDFLSIESIKLTCSGDTDSSGVGRGVYLTNCNNAKISDLWISGHRSDGIQVENCTDGYIANCRFFDSPVSDLEFNTQAGADIMVMRSCKRFIVTNNHCQSGNAVGVQIFTPANSGETSEHHVISGNIILDCKSYGILAYRNVDTVENLANEWIKGLAITGNVIRNIKGTIHPSDGFSGYSFGAGIYIQGGEDFSIVGNTLEKTHNGGVTVDTQLAPAAIGILNSGHGVVSGNVIFDAKFRGIHVGDLNGFGEALGQISVTGNVLNGAGEDGIYIKGRARVMVANNGVSNTAGDGISVNKSGVSTKYIQISVVNNTINTCGLSGINYKYGRMASVSGNTITNVANYGAVLDQTIESDVSHNRVVGYSVRAISITSSCSNNKFSCNHGNGQDSANYAFGIDGQTYIGELNTGVNNSIGIWSGAYAPLPDTNVYVQANTPADATPFIWFDTTGGDLQIKYEDGVP